MAAKIQLRARRCSSPVCATSTASGTKTDTPLMETAQAITVIDGEELIRRNALSINQALGYVAGVSPNQRGGMVTRYDQLYLRGFTPGVYLDGMRLIAGPYSTPQIDFNRIDQVDVVKGPASVLYGNSSPGGIVNLSSKRPEPRAFQRIELAAGNYDSQRVGLDLNRPLDSEGRVLFRVVGGAQRGDGFTAMTESERKYISPMLTLAPSEQTELTLIGSYQHDPEGGGYSGVPAFGSVLPNPFGELPEDINTGDPGYEVFNRYQRSIAGHVPARVRRRCRAPDERALPEHGSELSPDLRRGIRDHRRRCESQLRLLDDHARRRRCG